MPELPEVETIRSQLETYLPIKINSYWLSPVSESILHTPCEKLEDNEITQILRKGKMLNILLASGDHILSHLGMTGTWRVSTEPLNEKHKHIEIAGTNKDGDIYLTYVDPRRFGHMYVYGPEDTEKKLSELGPDLTQISYEDIEYAIKKFPNRQIKVHLLDQKYFAGSGNYIANEICARAGVRPTRRCGKITKSEIQKIFQATKTVIDKNIEMGGATFQGGYQDAFGEKGEGVTNLVVFYQQTCQLCGVTPVKKIILAQRGTYYCPKCQQ